MNRKKLLTWCAAFFAVMLVFTVLSRAAAAMTVAQVQIGKIQNQTITHEVCGNGQVEGISERAVFIRENQLVERILVREGQSVKKGDTMLVLSKKQLKKTIREKQDAVDELLLKEGDLESQKQAERREKSKALNRAREDYRIAAGNGWVDIANAQEALAAAQKKLDQYYASLSSEFTDKPADEAQEQALLEEIRMCRNAVDQAVMSSEQGKTAARRGIEDAQMEGARDSTLENVRRERERTQEELTMLKRLLRKKGRIKAPSDGVIKRISAAVGSITSQEAAVILYDVKGTFRVTMSVSADDIKYVETGAEVVLTGADEMEKKGLVEAVGEDEENPELKKVSVSVSEKDFRIGEQVSIKIIREEGPYSACVPLSALGSENGRYFVYVVEVQDSILGEVFVARKLEVQVKNKNISIAALQEGSLSAEQKIVTHSSREITDGSRVRLQEV